MPKRKIISKSVSNNIKQMRLIKSRLVEISLKVDNFIYQKKQLTKAQARCFLEEICSYKTQCKSDVGYLQVIEKLIKYMNIIIQKDDDGTSVSNVHVLNDESRNDKNFVNKNENVIASKEIAPALEENLVEDNYNEKQSNRDQIDNIKATSNSNEWSENRSIKRNCNILPSKSNIDNKTSPKLSEQTNSNIAAQNNCKLVTNFLEDKKCETSMAETVIYEEALKVNTVQERNSFQNSYCVFVCVDNAVINNSTLSNVAFKTLTSHSEQIPIPFQATDTIKDSGDKQTLSINVDKKKIANKSNKKMIHKKVKFSDIDILNKRSGPPNNNEPPSDKNSELIFLAEQKNTNFDINDTAREERKKSRPKKSVLDKNQNNWNGLNDKFYKSLSWIENIKWVREVNAKEYFKPLEITDSFWKDRTLPLIKDKEFNI